MLTEKDLVYIAGFFDGEGCVVINKGRNEEYRGGYQYQLRCSISQMPPCPLFNALRAEFGGRIAEDPRKGALTYCVAARQARTFLRAIVPYLRLKKEQAEAGIAFQNTKRLAGMNNRLSSAEFQAQDDAYRHLQSLKPTNMAKVTSEFQDDVTIDALEYIQLALGASAREEELEV